MQAKCLAQRLAHSLLWNGSCCRYWRLWSGLGSREDQASREEAPPTGTGPKTSSQGPLSSTSPQTLKPQVTKTQFPAAFLALRAQGGKRTRKHADIHQKSAPLKGSFRLCPHRDLKPSHFPKSMHS